MSTTIERLLTLQERDRRIARLRQESKDIPARREHIESRIEREKTALAKAQEVLKKQQSAAKQVELEVESRRERISKLRVQQFEVKSNDDYRTLEGEIKTLEKEILELEDRELVIMEEMDETRRNIAEKESELKRGEDHVQADLDSLKERMQSIEAETHDLETDRTSLAEGIDAEWLSRYERLFAHTRDFALVSVDHDTTCGGCHMKLPPQVVHDARKGLQMVLCPYCSRLLYWQP